MLIKYIDRECLLWEKTIWLLPLGIDVSLICQFVMWSLMIYFVCLVNGESLQVNGGIIATV